MARVQKSDRHDLVRNKVHGEAQCTYTSITSENGARYFQIDTYGSPSRKLSGKQSQSIQFDESAAKLLCGLLAKEFKF